MGTRHCNRSIRGLLWLAATLVLAGATLAPPASAQGFLESLFGSFNRPAYQPGPPPSASSYADPYTPSERHTPAEPSIGPSASYCVRTCDGRFFPIQRHANASPADLCRSFCPASKTMIFSGNKIDTAIAPNGTRYADLDKAFVYRERLVDGCTCNGKDAFGLVQINSASDPTLRPGDLVATNEGFATFRGKTSGKSAQFTPVSPASYEGRQLSEVKVVPAPPAAAPPAQVNNDPPPRTDRRRVQIDR